MDKYKILEIKESIYSDNDQRAEELRQKLKQQKVFLVNLMSSPGSGKTTTLTKVISLLKDRLRIGVMEADIDSDVDARTISDLSVRTIQLHTGGACHLDAKMTAEGLTGLGTDDLDLIFLENVGNLVCPAEFDTGAALNVMILSVPEGDDKALKYPLMFEVSQAVLINKIDTMSVFDFDMKKAEDHILARNPKMQIFPISAKTGEGVDTFAEYLYHKVKEY